MNRFKYKVTLEVEVEAFDSTDALDAIQDVFGLGEQNGVEIVDFEVTQTK